MEIAAERPTASGSLPTYSAVELMQLADARLLYIMIGDEDRVPMNVIDECVRRGAAFEQAIVDAAKYDEVDESPGRWWLQLHCAHVLGRMPTESAGKALIGLARRMEMQADDNLQEWLAGFWPALFLNKPISVAETLRAFCDDRAVGWFMRVNVMEAVIAMHGAQGEAALSEALDWIAGIAQSPDEEFDVRCHAGCLLLDFPRQEHRPMLENLGDLQEKMGAVFVRSDVERSYAKASAEPQWERFKDPWQFYAPAAIEARQKRWAEEGARRSRLEIEEAGDADDLAEFDDDDRLSTGRDRHFGAGTYVREMPKIGRNDPCPCGSKKKYKKCCLLEDSNDQ